VIVFWWGIRGIEEGSRDHNTLGRGGFYAYRLQRHVGLDNEHEQPLYPSSNDPQILHHQREMYMPNRAPRIGLAQLAHFEIPPAVASRESETTLRSAFLVSPTSY